MKTYLIIFKDGSMMPIRVKPDERDHQTGSRFFELNRTTTIDELQDYLGYGTMPKGMRELSIPPMSKAESHP